MKHKLNNFFTDESGAVTVDWVVLTAAVIGLGAAVASSVGTGTMSLANLSSTTLTGTYASLETTGMFLSQYRPLYEVFQSESGGVNATYREYFEDNNVDLDEFYALSYAAASLGLDPKDADLVALVENMWAVEGTDIPDGNMTAAEIRALYE